MDVVWKQIKNVHLNPEPPGGVASILSRQRRTSWRNGSLAPDVRHSRMTEVPSSARSSVWAPQMDTFVSSCTGRGGIATVVIIGQ